VSRSNNHDYTVGFGKANLGALIASGPFCIVFVLVYGYLYGWPALAFDSVELLRNPLLLVGSFILGIVVHEGIHAISWSWLDDIPWSKIHFGVKWSMLTPYVHCEVPIAVRNYRWGTALPGIILGFVPCLLGISFKIGWLFGFGQLFTLAAGGDFLMIWLLRSVDGHAMVQDHPDLIGCRIVPDAG